MTIGRHLLLLLLCLALPVPAQTVDSAPAAGPPSAKKPAPEKYVPGVGAWTMYRGDMLGSGVSHSPTPAYKGVKWRFFASGNVSCAPVVADGRIYFANEVGTVFCVDARSGKRIWSGTLGTGGIGQGVVHCSPLLYDGLLYFGTRPGRLYCVNAADGKTVWSKQLTETFERTELEHAIYSAPKGDQRGIVVPTMQDDGTIWCLHPKTGKRIWKIHTEREIGGSPVIIGNTIYVATKGRFLLEIDYRNGKILRRVELPGTTHCSPTFGLGYLFVVAGEDKACAIDLIPPLPGAPGGDPIRWIRTARTNGRYGLSFKDDTVYFPDYAGFKAANARTGETRWRFTVSSKPTDPLIVGPHALLMSRAGDLHAVDCKTGEEVWSTQLEYQLYQGPVVVDGLIYVPTLSKYVVCIE